MPTDAKTLVAVACALPPCRAILIRGDHGIGKSEIVRQVAEQLGLTFVDVRASTMSEGDVVGFPDLERVKETGTATFALPSWFMRACKEPCALMFDELNRGLPGVMNSLFQPILDRELGNGPDGIPVRLHPETKVFAAVNVGSGYTVSEIDPALLDRFWVTDFRPTVEDWLTWAKSKDVSPVIVDFIRGHPDHLRPLKETEPGKRTPTQRAWAHLDASLKYAGIDLEQIAGSAPDLLYPISTGFVGDEAAIALREFVVSYETILKADDVLDRWVEVKDKAGKLTADKTLALIEKVCAASAQKRWTDNQVKNEFEFWMSLTGELKMTMQTKMMSAISGDPKSKENAQANLVRHQVKVQPHLALVLKAAIEAEQKMSKAAKK